jgi:hypothetical protein
VEGKKGGEESCQGCIYRRGIFIEKEEKKKSEE